MEAMFKVLFHIFFILLVLVNSVWTQSPVRRLSSGIERTALLDLRTSLGIKARYWPKKLDPCTNWTGVECDNGRVTGINLSGLRRTRFVSPSFSVNSLVRCTQLVYFNSSGFALQGQIPDWLGRNLSALQVLDLTSSSVLGPIPPSIGSLYRLNRLLLSDNSLTGIIPDSLLQLSSLSVLNLSLNMLTGSIPSSFSALSNLSTLDLSSNFLSGPIPTGFGSISSLRFLNLSNNSLASTLPIQLSKLSQLIDLDLGFNSFTGSVPTEIEHLRNLRRFSIRNNNFGGNLPSNFTKNIILLDVSSNNLTGNLPNLSSFPNASGVTLNFSNNNFYGILNSGVPTPESIDLSHNYLQGFNGNIGNKTIISRNCFLQIPNQRSLDDCRTFYRLRNLPFNGDSFPDSIPPVQPQFRPNRTNRLKYVLAGVFGGIGVFIIGFIILFLLLKTCNKRTVNQRSANVEPIQEGTEKSQTISVNIFDSFSYEQLSQATSGFSDTNLVKRGHSGDMFSGKLEDGVSVVIKRVDMRNSRKDCYMRELELYGKGAHTRLVPLLGHCLGHETEKMLVYKFMPNGDLSNSLYRSNSLEDSGLQSLDWITRLKIAIGAAEGLVYLHHECNPPIVHRDIQASSILLDDKYEVRLGSLSEVCVQGVEDNPNVITKLLRISSNSEPIPSGSSSSPPICSYDVYCFGKVLLELVTGRIGINNSEWVDQTLTFINNYDKELVSKIIDQSLVIDEDLMEEVWAVAIVAKSCLNPKPSKRPQMAHILKALENPFRVVREEDFSSGRLRNNSSRRSWSAALFGSWRQSYSGSTHSQSQKSREGVSGQKRDNSQGSGTNDKKFSSEIFPEPLDINDVERQDGTRS